jgi:hypothetical protein
MCDKFQSGNGWEGNAFSYFKVKCNIYIKGYPASGIIKLRSAEQEVDATVFSAEIGAH